MNKLESFESFKNRIHTGVEMYLKTLFSTYPSTEVARIAHYVTLNGGHRWRPMVAIAAGKIFDAEAETLVMPGACGLEIAHAATMLMDDLPSMDNARMRRGKPCAHLVFPRWAVDMAAAYLVNMAYASGLNNPLVSEKRRVEAALELGRTALDLNKGQEKDVTQPSEHEEWENVLQCYRLKTGSFYAVSAKMGGILCGAKPDELEALGKCGMKVGLSVQCFDDVADVVAGVEEVGKHPGKDATKQTCVDFFGVDGSKEIGDKFVEGALAELKQFDSRADILRVLVRKINWIPDFHEKK